MHFAQLPSSCRGNITKLELKKMFSGSDDLAASLQFDYKFFAEDLDLSDIPELTPQHISSWKDIPMIQWSSRDVVDFIKDEIIYGYPEPVNLGRFDCISGYIFKTLGEEYCQILTNSEEFGTLIFRAKENYISSNHCKDIDCYPVFKKEFTQDCTIADYFQDGSPKRIGKPKIASRKRRKEKSQKLWEFLLHLLREKQTELIQWDNYEEGTFKFVKSDTVARLWGSRNHNQTMNYEKFTRAMRYHYKNKVLLPVPGRRLVYRFGPHAKGWQSSLPCC